MDWALLALILGQTPFASVGIEPQKTIIDLAFDPADYVRSAPIVSIRYLGDDYAYPVYAIAVHRECQGKSKCDATVVARMVRSPSFKKVERPRWAGMAVVRHVQRANATTREEVAAALDMVGLEWLEADVKDCPRAAAILGDLSGVTWAQPVQMPKPTLPDQTPPPPIHLHADIVSVAFGGWTSETAVYSGVIDNARPTGWAVRLAEALEPCWRPSRETPPWKR